ncbi:hypothetical protein I6N90_21360 [Paenibacillus sp. GSMTC-2017]|uniref:hypothetical protein n=1 Tax=Paenibacillus sp. GSMTC-2017 TaxID=2794350 RepID=UPI0018D8EBEC|nr:hypothetical protein [Paenibacillus sp. GSMTC-2017]MBH5320344.1 hypothetical protein [Paenibacillus sp. GSMTC-2017]
MSKYVWYIVSSTLMIVIFSCVLWYTYWDAAQPKTGVVFDGNHTPAVQHLVPVYTAILMGFANLPIAIMRYLQNKKLENMKDFKK